MKKKLILLRDKLGVARTGEVKLLKGVIDESKLIANVSWI